MSAFVEYLKSPELVVKVQEFFGIEYLHAYCDEKIDSFTREGKVNGKVGLQQQVSNGDLTSLDEDSSGSSTSSGNGYNKHQVRKDKPYRVTNKFWYYLFIIGTELGDEIFYATFIPFWFWNIDSAVGRRVIMVWSAVMYVGRSILNVELILFHLSHKPNISRSKFKGYHQMASTGIPR